MRIPSKNFSNTVQASEDLNNNKEFVLAAVKANGLALQYASEDLNKFKRLLMTSVQSS